MSAAELLEQALAHQPAARVCLGSALRAEPSHAFLFNGPRGVGKRRAAAAFAAALLTLDPPQSGERNDEAITGRVLREAHPDLTWVRPSGAHEMRVDDVKEQVIQGATRTPFEAARRVFVIEGADLMNPEVANRLLKTIEEPAPFSHFILITDAINGVLATIVSRCQAVRFDPIAPAIVAAELEATGIEAAEAESCARLAQGDAVLATWLASDEGRDLRRETGRIVAAALRGISGIDRPWDALIARAAAAASAAEESVLIRFEDQIENVPKGRERSAVEKLRDEAAKREARRARTQLLDRALSLASLLTRDLAAASAGAGDAVLARDRADVIERAAAGRTPRQFVAATERIELTRSSLRRNVAEALALEALNYELEKLFATQSAAL